MTWRLPGVRRKHLRLRMPEDERAAQAIRAWAVDRGIHLIERGTYSVPPAEPERYPYTCKHGHVVAGPEDESKQGRYDRCKLCRRLQSGRPGKAA